MRGTGITMTIAKPCRNAAIFLLAGVALALNACSAPTYPPVERCATCSGATKAALEGGADSYHAGKRERWWPDWADPANLFLEEKYQL